MIVDRALVFDTTISDHCSLLIEKKSNTMEILEDSIPEWVQHYLLEKTERII